MWFDARTHLAQIASNPSETSASQDSIARCVSQVSQVSQPLEVLGPVFRVACNSGIAARSAALRNLPPTCAACGVADWLVALTEKDGRTLHVSCWRAEMGQI